MDTTQAQVGTLEIGTTFTRAGREYVLRAKGTHGRTVLVDRVDGSSDVRGVPMLATIMVEVAA